MRRVSIIVVVGMAWAPAAVALTPLPLQVNVEQSASAGTLPKGAQRVDMMRVRFSAPCDQDIVVRSLKVHHRGLGAIEDIDRVYAMDGLRRVSRAARIRRSDETATLRFRSLAVNRCTVKTIAVLLDFSPSAQAGSQHTLTLELPEDIDANASVSVTTYEDAEATRIAPGETGSVSVEFLDLPSPLRYGERRTLARLRISADREKDQEIVSVTLTKDGSARGADLQNLFMETTRRERLSMQQDSLEGESVTFRSAPPLFLGRNAEQLLIVRGDIRASRKRTVK